MLAEWQTDSHQIATLKHFDFEQGKLFAQVCLFVGRADVIYSH